MCVVRLVRLSSCAHRGMSKNNHLFLGIYPYCTRVMGQEREERDSTTRPDLIAMASSPSHLAISQRKTGPLFTRRLSASLINNIHNVYSLNFPVLRVLCTPYLFKQFSLRNDFIFSIIFLRDRDGTSASLLLYDHTVQ